MMLALALLLQAAPPPPPTAAQESHTVATVVVTALPKSPPAVASTWPAAGAAVAPGTTVVKVAFDQAMAAASWRFSPEAGAAFPRCLERPRLLADNRTFVLLCVTTDGGSWKARVEATAAVGGKPAPPYDLAFTTTADRPVGSLDDAMKAASLADDQSPILDDKAQVASTPGGAPQG